MRSATLAILVVLLSTPAMAGGPDVEVADTLTELGREARSGRLDRVRALVDEDRLLEEVRAWAGLGSLSPEQIAVLRRAMDTVVGEIRDQATPRAEILFVRVADGGKDAALIARHIDDREGTTRRRWRFAKTAGVWRVYDVGPVGYRMPLSLVLASGLDLLRTESSEEDLIPVSALAQVAEALFTDRIAVARKLLDGIELDVLPPRIEGVRQVLTAAVLLVEDRPAEALAALDAADAKNPGMPFVDCLRACARNRQGRFEDALEHATVFLKATAGDGEGFHQAAIALARLDRGKEATASFEKALIEAPGSLAAMAAPLVTEEWRPALVALVAAARNVTPKNANLDFLDVQVLSLGGDHAAAAAKLLPLLAKIAERDSRDAWRRYYLDEMLAAGRPLTGAAMLADWPGALRHLGPVLAERGDGPRLHALLLTHAERFPEDPWLDYFRAEAKRLEGDFTGAEALFAAGAKRVESEADREEFRAARVYNLYRDGKGNVLEALIRVPPRGRTLKQLVWLCAQNDDEGGIATLLHRQGEDDPTLPAYLYCRSEEAWRAGHWDEAVAMLLEKRNEILADAELLYDFEDRVVRGLIRAGRHEDALRAARAIEKRDDDLWYTALALAAAGRAAETRASLVRLRSRGFTIAQMWEDEDLARALRAKGMETVREEFVAPTE